MAQDGYCYPRPPPRLAPLVELMGPEAVLRLIEERGGTRLYIPDAEDLNQANLLARIVGIVAARALAGRMGGDVLKVPMAKEWRAQILRERDGLSYAKIARRLGANESTVHRWLTDNGLTVQQDLFR